MTTDLQRLHQDEWLAALRSGDYIQCGGGAKSERARCALEVAMHALGATGLYLVVLPDLLGISHAMQSTIYARNDGWLSKKNPRPGYCWSYDEIADWFKAERDAWDGDLSKWNDAS